MNSQKLKLLNNAKDLSYELALTAADKFPGEPFQEGYKTNKELFRILMKADHEMYSWFKEYFSSLSELVVSRFHPLNYVRALQKAHSVDNTMTGSIFDDLIQVDWEGEEIKIRVFLIQELIDVIKAGGDSLADLPGFPQGFQTTTAQAMEFLNSYSVDLAKGLDQTTRKYITTALATSISLGENQSLAAERLRSVINDPERASVIAHTETVRAYNQGRIITGKELGATLKQWVTTIAACEICMPLNKLIVPINANFVNPDTGDEYEDAPAHPRCRCLVYPMFAQKQQ